MELLAFTFVVADIAWRAKDASVNVCGGWSKANVI